MLPEYIFWFLFDVAITNSFILCKEFSTLNVKAFRVELVKQLIGNYNSRKRPGDLASLLLSASAKSISPHMAVTRAIAVITVLSTRKNARSQCGFVKTASCTSGTGQDCFFFTTPTISLLVKTNFTLGLVLSLHG